MRQYVQNHIARLTQYPELSFSELENQALWQQYFTVLTMMGQMLGRVLGKNTQRGKVVTDRDFKEHFWSENMFLKATNVLPLSSPSASN